MQSTPEGASCQAANVERVLAKLQGVKPAGNGKWVACCPAHNDRHASLSIAAGRNGRVLVKCFAGCSYEAIRDALGLTDRDLGPRESRAHTSPPETGATVQHRSPRSITTPSRGCTLADYAEAKRLPVEFLQTLGVSDCVHEGFRAVRIPYLGADGAVSAVRFRLALDKSGGDDTRFRWRSRSKPSLYGLSRLAQAPKAGHVVLVEGESDCHTLWFHSIPALGVPGAATWREERDAPHLADIPKVYVVVEPDCGGEAVLRWLSRSSIRERTHLVRLDGHKDPSDLYLADPGHFRERWEAVLTAAQPWTAHAAQLAQADRQTAWQQCEALARSGHILDRFRDDLRHAGLVGEERLVMLVFLAVMSRFLDRPVSVAIKGPSSGGKSFLVERVLTFFPGSAHYDLSAMSEHALAYSDEPLVHRFLVLYETTALSNETTSYLMRSLLSEGRVRYETVEKTAEGLRSRLIERPGPTGLIVTTTAAQLHPENETRLFSLTVNDTREQTKQVMLALAEGTPNAPDLKPWHALQEWLQGEEHTVTIPYAGELAQKVPPLAVRLRRDFLAVLGLIKAHAILHQATRQRDAAGHIMATLEDYAVVRELVEPVVAEGIQAGVSKSTRETVKAVAVLAKAQPDGVAVTAVAKELHLDKSAASRRVKTAIQNGYLRNLEDRQGPPARLVLADSLPDGMAILPAPEDLASQPALSCSQPGEECNAAAQAGISGELPFGGDADGTVAQLQPFRGGMGALLPDGEPAALNAVAIPPSSECPTCGGADFWQRAADGPRVCSTCHPPPPGLAVETVATGAENRRDLGGGDHGGEGRAGR